MMQLLHSITVVAIISILITNMTISMVTAALYTPQIQVDWEFHGSSEIGTKTTSTTYSQVFNYDNNYWWWAKTFVYSAVFAYNSDRGAVGAGYVEYIPFESNSPIKQGAVYYWDIIGQRQGYSLGSAPSSTEEYKVYKTGGDCWRRIAVDIDSIKCINNMILGHPRYAVITDEPGNTVKGYYTSAMFKDNNGGSIYHKQQEDRIAEIIHIPIAYIG